MHIAVLGPAGFGGSNVCVELIIRGHDIIGISRSPEKLGKHSRYTPLRLDLLSVSVAELMHIFEKFDVLVDAFIPPAGPGMYKDFVETSRKILVAAKAAKLSYFIKLGGSGSLELGDSAKPYATCADSREFWLAYRRAVADSEAATYHMEERLGVGSPMATAMRRYREARLALEESRAREEDFRAFEEAETPVISGPNPIPDLPLATRATFQMFDGNAVFRWSFVSPPGMYRPGPRTGAYAVHRDLAPVKPESSKRAGSENVYEGRLLGISAADSGVAIANEVEKQEKVGWHCWSATADLPEDEAVSSYARL